MSNNPSNTPNKTPADKTDRPQGAQQQGQAAPNTPQQGDTAASAAAPKPDAAKDETKR